MIASSDFPKIPHIKKRAFLAVFSRCGSLSRAAKRAGVDRRTHYNWLRDDPWYKQAFRQAIQEAGGALEDKLNDLAHEEGNVTAAIFSSQGIPAGKIQGSHRPHLPVEPRPRDAQRGTPARTRSLHD